MKKLVRRISATALAAFLSIIILIYCTACNSRNTNSIVTSGSSADETSNAVIGVEPVTVHGNPRVDYTKEEVREIIDKYPNLKVSDDYFYASVPKEIDHLCEFYNGSAYQLSPEKELEEFRSVFKYLFPDHEFDENCLYAHAYFDDEDPNEQDVFKTRYHSLKNEDNYNAYMNGTLGNQEVIHFLTYTEEKFMRENSVSLHFRSPFGNDWCVFNKGVCNRFTASLRGEDKYYAYEQFRLFAPDADPDIEFEAVGTYPPDSEETFKLLDDKEISIKDAVFFFENYVASIPCLAEPVFGIHVYQVHVYKLDDEHYGFELMTSRIYDGIHFNYVWDGCDIDGLNRDMSYGIMVESGDVDHIYASFNAYKAYDEVQYSDFVPFEEAVKTVSEKMTEYVGFEVTDAELLFRRKSNVGKSNKVGETRYPTYPSWKLTLYNPNDNIRYVAYVNALTGEFEGGR